MLVHSLTAFDFLTAWHWSWPGAVLSAALAVGYALCWWRAHRRCDVGVARLAAYLIIGVGSLMYVTCGPVGYFSRTYMWMFALEVAVLAAVTPLGLAAGRPVDVLCSAAGSEAPRRALSGSLARALMFPLVSSVLSAVSICLVFYTGYGLAALRSPGIGLLLIVHLLFVGLLVALPLLTDDLLPKWATGGMKALVATLDGLIDAIPGILLMTASSLIMPSFPGFSTHHADLSASLDQRFAGGALLAVAESIGIPMLALVFIDWVRSDSKQAHVIDAELDAQGDDESTTPWWLTQAK